MHFFLSPHLVFLTISIQQSFEFYFITNSLRNSFFTYFTSALPSTILACAFIEFSCHMWVWVWNKKNENKLEKNSIFPYHAQYNFRWDSKQLLHKLSIYVGYILMQILFCCRFSLKIKIFLIHQQLFPLTHHFLEFLTSVFTILPEKLLR